MKVITDYDLNLLDEIKENLLTDKPSAKARLLRNLTEITMLYSFAFQFSNKFSEVKDLQELLGDKDSTKQNIESMTDDQCVEVISLINQSLYSIRELHDS